MVSCNIRIDKIVLNFENGQQNFTEICKIKLFSWILLNCFVDAIFVWDAGLLSKY